MQPSVRRVLVPALTLLTVGLASACSADDDTAGAPVASPSSPSSPASPSSPPATTAPAEPTEPAVTTPPAQPPSTPSPTPSMKPSPKPTSSATPVPTTVPGPSKALRSVRRDVSSITPQLESYYRDREYPVDLAQVQQTLRETGVSLAPGNTIGAYTYDGDAVEFVLCVENTSGAWATYDTAPMTVGRSGETGGCPG